MRSAPRIYEINTWVWLDSLSRKLGRTVQLASVPAEVWDELAQWGFDAVWLMGVWERSPAGTRIAREHPGLQDEFRRSLPDYNPNDIVGSPYCVHRYIPDLHFGGTAGLQAARSELALRGMGLILDFVPNHVAIDHPWTVEHPEYFIHDDSGAIANGRDPYFPPWTDTAQINVFNPAARAAMIDTMCGIAAQCDGVRCDMAMLLLREVFTRTWGDRAGTQPPSEFWSEAIPAVKSRVPGFVFIAEVYWDLEPVLLQQGFDFCYDKRLYDRLRYDGAPSARRQLEADVEEQNKLLRFIENHDESRAAAAFGRDQEQAAAIAISTLPGATLFQEGQFEGRKIKLPVQLGRQPEEPVDHQLLEFYRVLLACSRYALLRDGTWQLLEATGWPDNSSCANLLAWSWTYQTERALVIINYAPTQSQGRVRVPWTDVAGRSCHLADVLTHDVFERQGDELLDPGLFVDLAPWRTHLLKVAVD